MTIFGGTCRADLWVIFGRAVFSLVAYLRRDMSCRSPGDPRAGCFSLVVSARHVPPLGCSVASNLCRGDVLVADGFAEVMSQSIALPKVISSADGFAEMAIMDHHSGWLCRGIARDYAMRGVCVCSLLFANPLLQWAMAGFSR